MKHIIYYAIVAFAIAVIAGCSVLDFKIREHCRDEANYGFWCWFYEANGGGK